MSSPPPSPPVAASPGPGSTTARASSPPGGVKTMLRRKAAADRADKVANARPASTRAAGAGGSSSTMLRLYTDESPGLKVDPVVVLVLSLGFIFSVVALHISYSYSLFINFAILIPDTKRTDVLVPKYEYTLVEERRMKGEDSEEVKKSVERAEKIGL